MKSNDLWPIAIHESGHAVVARKLGLSCSSVSIVPDLEAQRITRDAAGKVVMVPDPVLGQAEVARRWWPERESTQRDIDEAFVVQLFAGIEAERVICGKVMYPNADRIHAATVLGDDAVHLEPELRARANVLVRQHRAAIILLAETLLESRTLIPLRVDAIVQLATLMAEQDG